MGRTPSSPSALKGRPGTYNPKLATFTTFAANVIARAEVATPVLLASLVYINRAKPHLHIALEEWALERVFLGALMTASKYLNDSTLKNVHWALCTGVFGKRDVGRIEREFLDVLDFELRITEDDVLSYRAGLLALIHPPPQPHRHTQSKPHSSFLTPVKSHAHRHHQIHTHSHGVQRPSTRHEDVPALSPSSPVSSSASSSPCTPAPSPPSKRRPSLPHSKKPLHVSTMDLLRAFPIPRSMAAHAPIAATVCT
jgi:hypothetical protein